MFARIVFGLGLAVIVLSGCADMQTVYYQDAPKFEPRPYDHEIDTYLMDDAPDGLQRRLAGSWSLADVPTDAIKLGRIDLHSAGGWIESINAATTKAIGWGGDAIVIDQAILRFDGGWKAYEFSAEVIRYRDDAEQISDSEDEQEAGGD